MVHLIESSTLNDLDHIFSLYDEAMRFQQAKKKVVVWPKFATSLVLQEINEERQWKLLIDGEIACVWAIAFSDPQIWEEKDRDPAIYIHRIATSSKFRGLKLVKKIVDWAKVYAIKKEKNMFASIRLEKTPASLPTTKKWDLLFWVCSHCTIQRGFLHITTRHQHACLR